MPGLHPVVEPPPVSSLQAHAVKSAVADNTVTTLVTVDNSAGTEDLLIDAIYTEGEAEGLYFVVLDTAVVGRFRTTASKITGEQLFATPQRVPVGSILDVKVEHYRVGVTCEFSASVWGHTS